MGNSSSHTHEPLDKGFTRGTYGDVKNSKSASFRFSKRSPKKMDRLRRSFRDSFRRRKDRVPESSKPHQWQADDQAVRSATCSFPVKYLGCVEVFESRGMQVCEEALKVLRNSRRRAIRGLLHVSGDGLRVVDDDTKGLIVDQTIEKVSFCAPDRNHERGFSYICRDGTTRRWMCHGFLASKDSGERLSHAVGCAFAVCLERKQRRDTECGVTMTFDMKNSTFTRSGSFRTHTITERLNSNDSSSGPPSAIVTPQPKPHNPFAIERPHVTPLMLERLERQGSFRAVSTQSPFKRQMSLRINDLPSNAERQKAYLDPVLSGGTQSIRGVSPIPEISPQKQDTVAQLCQELSQGLSLLTRTDDNDDLNFNNIMSINQNNTSSSAAIMLNSPVFHSTGSALNGTYTSNTAMATLSSPTAAAGLPYKSSANSTTNTVMSVFPMPSITSGVASPPVNLPLTNVAAMPTAQVLPYRSDYTTRLDGTTTATTTSPPITPSKVYNSISSPTAIQSPISTTVSAAAAASVASPVTPTTPTTPTTSPASLPKAEQWLGQIVKSTSPSPRRTPSLNLHSRAKSLSSASDPFDAEWAAGVAKPEKQSTNPFISPPKPPAQSFQVQL